MAELLEQLEPGSVALRKGVNNLLGGREARCAIGWKVKLISPPDRLEEVDARAGRLEGIMCPEDSEGKR